MVRRARLPVILQAAALLMACAPALREAPPLSTIGVATGTDAAAVVAPAGVDHALAEAAAAFARRPDMPAVAAAYRQYLAAARADEGRVDGLLGAMRTAAWLIEHEPGEARRSALATEAVQAGQWCLQRAQANIECTYRLAIALGQQAREHRTSAKDGLDRMVAMLDSVVRSAPDLDRAGGHRVLALVLLRAPGWPAGPGDSDAALEHAREADRLSPHVADNLMVLGEALAKAGDVAAARASYQQAERLAREQAEAGDPDAKETAEAATRALARLRPPRA
jgi:tetratricopeptide (TPR) repeat protein